MAQTLRITVRITGVKETLKAFSKLPKEASKALRERTLELSETLAGRVRVAARADSPQSALMAGTVKAKRDRVPVIQAGGMKRVGRNRKPAHKILFGSEFGASVLPQFRPHVGRGSYWMFREVERNEHEIATAWQRVTDDIAREWAR